MTSEMSPRRRAVAAGLALLPWAGALRAQPAFTRPLRLVVPFAPGGATDLVARAIAEPLGRALGQTVVVENRSGAGGTIGMAEVARAAPDGHTLGLATVSTHGTNPAVYRQLPYDPVRGFAPVTRLVVTPNVLVAHPSVPAPFAVFLRHAKSHPGRLSYASAGHGAAGHLGMELFKAETGTFLLHIPYRGAGPAKSDLLAGQVHVMLDNLPGSLPQIRAGQLRALALSAPRRLPDLPDVPTFGELGLHGSNQPTWFGLVAPAGTPPALVNAVRNAVAAILDDPAFRARARALGMEPSPSTPDDFAAQIRVTLASSRQAAAHGRVVLD